MFKIGDKVYLRDDSEFNDGLEYNPLNVLGSVVKLTPEDVLDYEVEWENGTVNGYNAEDLQLFSTLFVEQQDPLGSPLVTIPQSEYDNLVEEINMLQELVAELSKTNVNLAMEYSEQFKPISEYTLADWELAYKEGWEFECRDGKNVRIMYTYSEGDYVSRGDDDLTRTVDGYWIFGKTDNDDIVKRIK